MRIGILGGSFNPPHWGHLFMAEYVRDALALEAVWFVVAPRPPHKLEDPELAPAEDRLRMTQLAVAEAPGFLASDLEFAREGPSYTVHTLEELQTIYPEARLHLILGSDSLRQFASWREPHRIVQLAQLVVVERPGYESELIPAEWRAEVTFLEAPLIGISASAIRERVRRGQSIRFWVPEPVRAYIEERGLYRVP